MTHTPNLPAAFVIISLSLALIFFCISKLRKISEEIGLNPGKKVEIKIITEKEIVKFISFVRSLSCQNQRSYFVKSFLKNHGEDLKKYHYGWWIFLKNPGKTVFY